MFGYNLFQKKNKSIRSVSAENPKEAFKFYKNENASLYFGAPVEFRDLYMKYLNLQMGQNFGGYYRPNQDINIME
jgi:hypothetical protein